MSRSWLSYSEEEEENVCFHQTSERICSSPVTKKRHSNLLFLASSLDLATSEPSETTASQEWRKELLRGLRGGPKNNLLLLKDNKGEGMLPFHLWHALLSLAYFEDVEMKREALDVLRGLNSEVISVRPTEVGRRLSEEAVKTGSKEAILAVALLMAECNRILKTEQIETPGESSSEPQIVFDRGSYSCLHQGDLRGAVSELREVLADVAVSGVSEEVKSHLQKVIGEQFREELKPLSFVIA